MIYLKIKRLCSENNITIAALEKKCGLGNAVIKGWERCSPRTDKIKAVADYFGVSVDYLISEEPAPAEAV